MRINLCVEQTDKVREVINCWSHVLGEEFVVPHTDAIKWIFDAGSQQFVADVMTQKGWKVSTYTTPSVYNKCYSSGYVVEDPDHMLELWKLTKS